MDVCKSYNGYFVKLLSTLSFISMIFSTIAFGQLRKPEPPPTAIPLTQTREVIALSSDWTSSDPFMKTTFPFFMDDKTVYTFTYPIDLRPFVSKTIEFSGFGLNHRSMLSVNDQFVSNFQGGYLNVSSIIPNEFLRPDSASIVSLEIDGRLDYRNTLPVREKPGDPISIAGVLSTPRLIIRPLISVDHVNIQTHLLPTGQLSLSKNVWIRAGNLELLKLGSEKEKSLRSVDKLNVVIQIFSADNLTVPLLSQSEDFTILSDRNQQIKFPDAPVNFPLWSPENPQQLLVVTSLVHNDQIIDQLTIKTGIKSVQSEKNAWQINGKQTKIKGIVLTEAWWLPIDERKQELKKQLASVKLLGANAIRVLGYPASDQLLTSCDSLGILVLQEIPVFSPPSEILEEINYQLVVENFLQKVSYNSTKHPSVLMIGLGGNYTRFSDIDLLKKWQAIVKSENPTLLTYLTTTEWNSNLFDSVTDWVGYDLSRLPLDQFKIAAQKLANSYKSFIATYGVEISPQNTNGYNDEKSISYQAKYFIDRFKFLNSSDIQLSGFVFSLQDIWSGTPRMVSGKVNPLKISTGLVNEDGTPRPAFDFTKSLYNSEIVFNPTAGKKDSTLQVIFPIIGVIVIFIFMAFFNSNKRFRDNLSRSLFRSFSFYSDVRDHRIIMGFQTLGVIFLTVVIASTFALSISWALRYSPQYDYLLSVFIPWDYVKLLIIEWTWNPLYGLFILSLINLVIFFGIIFVIKLFVWAFKRKLSVPQAIIAYIWSLTPMFTLLIISMVAEQIVGTENILLYIGLFTIGIFFYTTTRALKGLKIILLSKPINTYFFGYLIVLLIFLAIFFHYEYYYDLTSYIANALYAF